MSDYLDSVSRKAVLELASALESGLESAVRHAVTDSLKEAVSKIGESTETVNQSAKDLAKDMLPEIERILRANLGTCLAESEARIGGSVRQQLEFVTGKFRDVELAQQTLIGELGAKITNLETGFSAYEKRAERFDRLTSMKVNMVIILAAAAAVCSFFAAFYL